MIATNQHPVLKSPQTKERKTIPEPECVNLRSLFGDRFKISFDPAADADKSLRRDPFYFLMQCKAGELSPQGGTILRLEMARGAKRRRLRILERLKGRVSTIEFADVWVLLFDVAELESVLDLIEPRKRRQLTQQQRQAASERLREYRFPKQGASRQQGVS